MPSNQESLRNNSLSRKGNSLCFGFDIRELPSDEAIDFALCPTEKLNNKNKSPLKLLHLLVFIHQYVLVHDILFFSFIFLRSWFDFQPWLQFFCFSTVNFFDVWSAALSLSTWHSQVVVSFFQKTNYTSTGNIYI